MGEVRLLKQHLSGASYNSAWARFRGAKTRSRNSSDIVLRLRNKPYLGKKAPSVELIKEQKKNTSLEIGEIKHDSLRQVPNWL